MKTEATRSVQPVAGLAPTRISVRVTKDNSSHAPG
jgi:hypothetical protein